VEKSGKTFLFRSSATFVPIRAGIAPGKIVAPENRDVTSSDGSLVVVGSYVPKTTLQLNYLLSELTHQALEVDVTDLLKSTHASSQLSFIVRQTDQWLLSGKDVVIYTSRKLEVGNDAESSLKINGVVSTFLVNIVKGLTTRPSFIIAKGGITSSDLASKGLSAKKALILGQAIPGVPVWKLDFQSKFPEILYIVFPGNVGGETALSEVCKRFKFNN
ncbi:MAG TPA: nucleotide-binding domain containing protein, partial [Chryseolinea sp.]|nr:nucleotide-binding domain containing protein [Chryseolinea sp.]